PSTTTLRALASSPTRRSSDLGPVVDEEAFAVGSTVGERAAHPAGDALGVSAESIGAGDSAHATSPFEGDGFRPRSRRSTPGVGGSVTHPAIPGVRTNRVRPPEPINAVVCDDADAT